MKRVCLTINGRPYEFVVDHGLVLLDLLRDELGLTGAKQGCDRKGQCGACTVIVNGKAVLFRENPYIRPLGNKLQTTLFCESGAEGGIVRRVFPKGVVEVRKRETGYQALLQKFLQRERERGRVRTARKTRKDLIFFAEEPVLL